MPLSGLQGAGETLGLPIPQSYGNNNLTAARTLSGLSDISFNGLWDEEAARGRLTWSGRRDGRHSVGGGGGARLRERGGKVSTVWGC